MTSILKCSSELCCVECKAHFFLCSKQYIWIVNDRWFPGDEIKMTSFGLKSLPEKQSLPSWINHVKVDSQNLKQRCLINMWKFQKKKERKKKRKKRWFHNSPVRTRRRFDVHTTSITLKRRRMDVKTTPCAYWVPVLKISSE